MEYIEHIPKSPLGSYIKTIWYCSANELKGTNLTVPLINQELVINFSDDFRVWEAETKYPLLQKPVAWINGLQTKTLYSSSSGKHEMMGVLFQPMGLRAFTRYSLNEFADDFVNPRLVFGESFYRLLDKLYHTQTPSRKILLIERFFLSQLIGLSPPGYLAESMDLLSGRFSERVNQ